MKSKDWRPTAFAETAPGVVTEEESNVSRADQRRAFYEFLRHLMTLDSGALVLTVALIGKAFAQSVNRSAVGLAVCAFLASLACGAITYLNLLANYPRVGARRMSSSDLRFYLWSMAGTVFCFIAGMGALAWFFWTNWFR